MKVARFSRTQPLLTVTEILSGSAGPDGQSVQSLGSNTVGWGSNVGVITVNQTTQVIGPYVNFANGSNVTITVDQVGATASNTIRWHATGGGSVSFGSNATRVSEVSSVGAGSDSARTDHIHDGIGTITASSSNTMQRGTWNLRPGAGIALNLTDTDGDGEFDTTTIVNTGSGGGGGSSSTSDPILDIFGTPDTAFEFDTSSLSGLTAMGSPDTENADTTFDGHYYVADNDSLQVGRYLSATPPFTAICKITEATLFDNYKYVGLFAGVSTPGRFQGIYLQFNNTNVVNVKTFTSPSDTGPGTESVVTPPYEPGAAMPVYLGVKVNSSTNVDYYFSRSPGRVWYPIALARDPLATIASVGISVGAYTGTVQAAYDFLRVWNSAKTFPAFS